jgi:hypothetical protein
MHNGYFLFRSIGLHSSLSRAMLEENKNHALLEHVSGEFRAGSLESEARYAENSGGG